MDLPSLHQNQTKVLREKARFNVVNCGRRFGKSVLGIDLAIDTALSAGRAGWFAPEYKLLSEAWRDIKGLCADITKSANNQERRIELITGGVIEAWSFDRNPNAGRSRKYHRVVIDEAAHADNLETVWTKAVRPTLTDYKGDAWFLSSPNGENYFHKLYKFGEDGRDGWKAWTFTSYDNPYLDRNEIDSARFDLTDWIFDQEYLAKFHSESEDVLIPPAWVDRCADPGIVETCDRLRRERRTHRRMACDLGYGTGADRTVIVVADEYGVLHLESSNSVGVPEAASRLATLAREWGVPADRICFDANGPGRDLPRYLEQHRIEAQPYHGSGKGGPKHANKRSRCAWRLRQRLDPERPTTWGPEPAKPASPWDAPKAREKPRPQDPFSIPAHFLTAKAREELKALRYHMDGAKVALEEKTELVKRLGRSPDIADSMIMLMSIGDTY